MRAIFSYDQQQVLQGFKGSLDHEYDGSRRAGSDYRLVPHKVVTAHVYEGSDPSEIVVATSLYNEPGDFNFDDAVDLGPVGPHLGSFGGEGWFPTYPMVLDRARLLDLLAGRLGPEELVQAREKAMERASTPSTPSP